jgi:DNA-binding response OmpR family regulator
MLLYITPGAKTRLWYYITMSDDPSVKKPVILIVEDDPVLSKMYTEKFTFEGFLVHIARDGEEAYQKATTEEVSIVLLDIMLPRMSGTDFLERFRKTPKGKDVPVVALTNLAEDDEKSRALKLGVKEYLVKANQTPDIVVRKVKSYVSS